MNVKDYKEQIAETVERDMLDFMREYEDCGYTEKHVKKCVKLLESYIDSLAALSAPDDASIMNCVKNTVLELNRLNEQTDYALIETEQREAVWEIIQNAAEECGLSDPPDDVTEQWREW